MKHYDSFENINNDKFLLGEQIWAFDKLDGQNFCVKYNARKKEFCDFGSKKCNVDETHEQFGPAVIYFKNNIADNLLPIIIENSGKKGIFTGADELTFYFEWWGENSFAGFHQEGDEMHLTLIDVNIKKKGYIDPKSFYEIFCQNDTIETPNVVYIGPLNQRFIDAVYNFPVEDYIALGKSKEFVHEYNEKTLAELINGFKEGVVCRRITHLKGQRMPKVKVKTKWWLDQIHAKFSEDKWKDLE